MSSSSNSASKSAKSNISSIKSLKSSSFLIPNANTAPPSFLSIFFRYGKATICERKSRPVIFGSSTISSKNLAAFLLSLLNSLRAILYILVSESSSSSPFLIIDFISRTITPGVSFGTIFKIRVELEKKPGLKIKTTINIVINPITDPPIILFFFEICEIFGIFIMSCLIYKSFKNS